MWAVGSAPIYFFLVVWCLIKKHHQKNEGNKKVYGNPNCWLEKLSNHRTANLLSKLIRCVQHGLAMPLPTTCSRYRLRIWLFCNLIPRAATLPHWSDSRRNGLSTNIRFFSNSFVSCFRLRSRTTKLNTTYFCRSAAYPWCSLIPSCCSAAFCNYFYKLTHNINILDLLG